MPELPDLTVYLEALEHRLLDQQLLGMRIASPFVLRTAEPPVDAFSDKTVTGFRRIGKRLVIELTDDHFIVIHLMIAGRLRWYQAGKKMPAKLGLMAFDFQSGSLTLTEASQKHRASVCLVKGMTDLKAYDQGGLEVIASSLDDFRGALSKENHTLKRSMTDQKFLAGIGNAYSDEIFHYARISPMRQIRFLGDDEWQRLHNATIFVLNKWTDILREKSAGKFPVKVTAFHEEMAAHGKYRQPCPDCGKPIQRIRYANNECNYCAQCQNQGNLLADRGLSKLLKKDWPKTLEELDQIAPVREKH